MWVKRGTWDLTIENTRIPRGSSRRRPTGNLRRRLFSRHCTNLFVDHTIRVHRRSRAESSREAMRDSEEDWVVAIALAANSNTLAMMLICMLIKFSSCPKPGNQLSYIDGPSGSAFRSMTFVALVLWQKLINSFSNSIQSSFSV